MLAEKQLSSKTAANISLESFSGFQSSLDRKSYRKLLELIGLLFYRLSQQPDLFRKIAVYTRSVIVI